MGIDIIIGMAVGFGFGVFCGIAIAAAIVIMRDE